MNTLTATLPLPKPERPAPDPYERGVNYMLGRGGVAADLGMAAASFLDAADANDARGLYAAGMMYLKGIGVTGNAETATAFLQKSAAAGFGAATRVLDALGQGRDVSAYPIVAPEKATQASKSGGATAAAGNPVTPGRVLAIVAAVVLVVGGSGGGYWAYSKQQAAAAEQLRTAEAQRVAAEEQQRAALAEQQRLTAEAQSAKESAAAALREADAEKQKSAEQLAELAARADALQQRAQALESAPARVAAATPTPPVAVEDWAALLKQSVPHLRNMMDAALANGAETVVREAAAIRALPQPPHGDRKLARTRNSEGLAALKAEDAARAAASLNSALAADMADEEIATNLGYALVKAGRPVEAQGALQRALHLNPGRSSAWYNMGLAFVAQEKEQAAYASFLLTYQFAGSQQKSREWFERVAQDDTNPMLKRLAQRLLASPAVAGTTDPTATAATAMAQLVQAAAAAVPAAPAAAPLPQAKGRLTQFCGERNFISRQLCESRECVKPENATDPFCADFLKRKSGN